MPTALTISRSGSRAAKGAALVAAVVVEHHDIAVLRVGPEELLQPGIEDHPVDGCVVHAGRFDPVMPPSGDDSATRRHELWANHP